MLCDMEFVTAYTKLSTEMKERERKREREREIERSSKTVQNQQGILI